MRDATHIKIYIANISPSPCGSVMHMPHAHARHTYTHTHTPNQLYPFSVLPWPPTHSQQCCMAGWLHLWKQAKLLYTLPRTHLLQDSRGRSFRFDIDTCVMSRWWTNGYHGYACHEYKREIKSIALLTSF